MTRLPSVFLLQVRHRFLKCVALTCFYIAAKLEEKAEVSVLHVVDGGGERRVRLIGVFK